MLQPLGISAEAEAVYVALGPLRSASVGELARLTSSTPERVAETLDELRKLGLATDSSLGHWRALPLLDVVNQLKAQRLSEIESRAWRLSRWKTICWRLGPPRPTTSRSSWGANPSSPLRELLNSARREICAFDKPPYAQARPNVTEEALSVEPEWQALERNVTLRVLPPRLRS